MVGVAGSTGADEEGAAEFVVSRRSATASRTESAVLEPIARSALPADVAVARPVEEVGSVTDGDCATAVSECLSENPPLALARGVVAATVLVYAE